MNIISKIDIADLNTDDVSLSDLELNQIGLGNAIVLLNNMKLEQFIIQKENY